MAASSGFSLHAGVAAKPAERDKLKRLARYIARPPAASERLALTENGQVRYTLKTPYRDGTTHVIADSGDAGPRFRLKPATIPAHAGPV